MTLMEQVLAGGWFAVTQVWLGLLIAQMVAKRRGLLGGEAWQKTCNTGTARSVTVVIPARNEAVDLEACVKTVLRQDEPVLSVLIVNDRSEDETASIAAHLVERDTRVSVLHVTELPAGWMGKSHALWTGTRQISSDWLLFVDADCRLEPGAVRAAMDEATAHEADVLTWWARHRGGSFAEHLIIPLCGAVIALWFGLRGLVRPASSMFGNGQFLLVRREAYEQIDGHRGVRDALIEDVPLAEAACRAGLRCRASSGCAMVSVRMYRTAMGVVDGWSRIFVGALRSGWRIALSIAWLAVGSLLPFVMLPIVLGADHVSAIWLGLCVQHLLLMTVVSLRFWKLGGCDRRYLLLYPLSVAVVMAILLRAGWWLSVRRRVSWRGRTYAIDGEARILMYAGTAAK